MKCQGLGCARLVRRSGLWLKGVSGCGVRETEHREAGRACMGSSLTRPWTLGLPWGHRRA